MSIYYRAEQILQISWEKDEFFHKKYRVEIDSYKENQITMTILCTKMNFNRLNN